MTAINLSRIHFPVSALGPGRRIGIWFQGCSLRCPGCISADTWAHGKGRTTIEAIIGAIAPWLVQADGVTISGGEPFEQPEALLTLLAEIRERFGGDVLVYSGLELSDIGGVLVRARGLVDALITGPYRHDEPQTLALRGSDNQQLHLLTKFGRARFARFEKPMPRDKPALDVMFDDDGTIWFAGIPRRDDFQRLHTNLETAGHQVATSADRSIGKAKQQRDCRSKHD